jgi:FkbM family methyltransferase
MQLHLFHFTPHGLARAYSHLVAGKKLCRAAGLKLKPLIPDSVNSMTAAWNVYQTFKNSGLPRPKTIIDVGANVSQMTRMLLGIAPDARVLSFEPNKKLSPAGEVYQIALSDEDGTTDFFIPQNDSDWGTIEAGKVNITSGTAKYSVPTRRMESLIESGEIAWKEGAPVLVKIDTEGSEKKVIDGFGKYLRDVAYLLVEVENQESRGQTTI